MAKRKRNKPKPDPAWTPFVDETLSTPDSFFDTVLNTKEERAWFEAVYRNSRYQVMRFKVPVDKWPGGYVEWLNIKRLDRDWIHDWRELQRIKNEICGKDREAVEIYPHELRLVDTSNQYHLWVMAPGTMLPFGYFFRAVLPHIPSDRFAKGSVHANAQQREFEDPPEDMIDPDSFVEAIHQYEARGDNTVVAPMSLDGAVDAAEGHES